MAGALKHTADSPAIKTRVVSLLTCAAIPSYFRIAGRSVPKRSPKELFSSHKIIVDIAGICLLFCLRLKYYARHKLSYSISTRSFALANCQPGYNSRGCSPRSKDHGNNLKPRSFRNVRNLQEDPADRQSAKAGLGRSSRSEFERTGFSSCSSEWGAFTGWAVRTAGGFVEGVAC